MSDVSVFSKAEHEAGIVSWVVKAKQARFLNLIGSSRGRGKLLNLLYHNPPIQEALLVKMPLHLQDPASIASELKRHGGGTNCYCFTTNSNFDGQFVDVREALEALVGSGDGTVLSLIPGKLGYYEGEEQEERYVINYDSGFQRSMVGSCLSSSLPNTPG